MSAGKTHTNACLILAGGFLVGAIATWDPSNLQYVVGALLGVVVGPDIDVNRGNVSYTYIRNSWRGVGEPLEKAWRYFWGPYRDSVKHGSDLSHKPVIGTMGRVGYIFYRLVVFPHIIIAMLFSPTWNLWFVLQWYMYLLMSGYRIILALMAADFIHWILDLVTTRERPNKFAYVLLSSLSAIALIYLFWKLSTGGL